MKLTRKVLSVFLSFVLMCTAWLPPVSAATANEVNDSKVYMADELSTAAKEYLANYGIPINDDSRFILSTASNNTRSSANSASVQIVTKDGNQTTVSTVCSFSTNGDVTEPDAKLAELFTQSQARNGSNFTFIDSQRGFKVVGTCVYTSYTAGGYTYLHLQSEYFTYYDQGGTAPSKIQQVSACVGDLYTKSGTTMTWKQRDYRHEINYTKYSPATNTMYSYTNEMSTNQYIRPNAVFGGLSMGIFVTISGVVYRDENSLTYY